MTREKPFFDLAVIGAGPGGYVAAIRAAQRGKKVALIEKKELGGTCLNIGCIPTKTLLASSSLLEKIKKAEEFGISLGEVHFDYAKMKARKDQIVQNIRKSLEGLLKTNQITIIKAEAKFSAPFELKVQGEETFFLKAEKIIIATGSESVEVPSFPCNHKTIRNSTSMLELTEVPKRLVIVGGGYIGCEFASLFKELGSEVTIVEALDSLVPLLGKEVATALTKAFEKQGINIKTEVLVEKIEADERRATLFFSKGEKIEAEVVLVSVGRKVFSSHLDLQKAGIYTDERGSIQVNDKMETNVKGIYAVGDVTGKAMLAHVASHQALVAAENVCGGNKRIHYYAVPAVVFTSPEIATVGYSIEEAKKEGYDPVVGKFPFQVLGKSLAAGEVEGFAQIISEKKTGQILGAQVVGQEASTLIAEITLAMQNELTLEALSETIHAHPTVAEGWLEAAFIAQGSPVHYPPRKR